MRAKRFKRALLQLTDLFNVPNFSKASFKALSATSVAALVAASTPASAPARPPASAPAIAPALAPLSLASLNPNSAPALAPALAAIFIRSDWVSCLVSYIIMQISKQQMNE